MEHEEMKHDAMDHEGYKKAAEHWKKIDAQAKKMPAEALKVEIEAYIQANNTCALATGSGSQIRNTPIEYAWHEGAFWMFSEGGEKFIGLEKNKNVSLAIFDKYDGFGRLNGLQVQGIAEVIEPFSEAYNHAAECKKIPIEALKKLPEVMNLIKVTPVRMNYLSSELKKKGYGSRQEWIR